MELGSKIKQLRLRADLTQEELADRCELTKGYISQLENDNTSPSIATLEDIVKALGITLADLFSETEEPNVIFKAEDCNEKDYDGYSTRWNRYSPLFSQINRPTKICRMKARNSATYWKAR